jgi:hypothetical protein
MIGSCFSLNLHEVGLAHTFDRVTAEQQAKRRLIFDRGQVPVAGHVRHHIEPAEPDLQ